MHKPSENDKGYVFVEVSIPLSSAHSSSSVPNCQPSEPLMASPPVGKPIRLSIATFKHTPFPNATVRPKPASRSTRSVWSVAPDSGSPLHRPSAHVPERPDAAGHDSAHGALQYGWGLAHAVLRCALTASHSETCPAKPIVQRSQAVVFATLPDKYANDWANKRYSSAPQY